MLKVSQTSKCFVCNGNNIFCLPGTIRYIPDEEASAIGSQHKTNQKPKRNTADSDSEEEISNLTSETRVNGHGHHRSGRKKSKSGRVK